MLGYLLPRFEATRASVSDTNRSLGESLTSPGGAASTKEAIAEDFEVMITTSEVYRRTSQELKIKKSIACSINARSRLRYGGKLGLDPRAAR